MAAGSLAPEMRPCGAPALSFVHNPRRRIQKKQKVILAGFWCHKSNMIFYMSLFGSNKQQQPNKTVGEYKNKNVPHKTAYVLKILTTILHSQRDVLKINRNTTIKAGHIHKRINRGKLMLYKFVYKFIFYTLRGHCIFWRFADNFHARWFWIPNKCHINLLKKTIIKQ